MRRTAGWRSAGRSQLETREKVFHDYDRVLRRSLGEKVSDGAEQWLQHSVQTGGARARTTGHVDQSTWLQSAVV